MKTWIIDCETELIEGDDSKLRTRFHVPRLAAVGVMELGCDRTFWVFGDDWFAQMYDDLCGGDDRFVFHNAAFDLSVLSKHTPEARPLLERAVFEGRVIDTMVLYRHAYPKWDRSASLAAVYEHLFGKVLEKGEVRTSFRAGQPLTEEQRIYLANDVFATREVFQVLREKEGGELIPRTFEKPIQCAHLPRSFEIRNAYHQAAALRAWYLEPRGLGVDLAVLDTLVAEHRARVKKGLVELWRNGLAKLKKVPKAPVEKRLLHTGEEEFHKFHGSWRLCDLESGFATRFTKKAHERAAVTITLDEKALRNAYSYWAEKNHVDPEITPGGKISLNYDFWKGFRGQLPPKLLLHLELGKTRKYLSSYLERPAAARPERVFPHYAIPGAETGRWACWGPPAHQIPKSIRPVYRACPGHTLVGCDYKSLELYTLAQTMYCHGIDGPMRRLLNAGADIHTSTAKMLTGRDEVSSEDRQRAKACNFGLPGGMGARRFWLHCTRKLGLQLTFEDAHALRAAWFRAFPDVASYLELFELDPYDLRRSFQTKADFLHELGLDGTWPRRYDLLRSIENGEIFTVYLPSGRVIPRRRYSAAANIGFQGPGADIITLAFVEACRAGLEPVAVIHDSLVVECSVEKAEEVSSRLLQAMRLALGRVCPDLMLPALTCWTGEHLQ